MLPVVLCIDVEPDRRLPRAEPMPLLGFEALLRQLPRLRDRLGVRLGQPPQLTWTLRLDPHMATVYGASTWVADSYGRELARLRTAGDALGVHPHMWRLEPDGWWSDNGDDRWVEHCVAMSLASFERAFGEPCPVARCGDRFVSGAVGRQLEAAGVEVDLTVEPGLPAVARLAEDEPTRGSLPDTRTTPSSAYRVSTTDMREAAPDRPGALVELPLTPGVTVSPGDDADGRPAGRFATLTLWTQPQRFAVQLERRLQAPSLTHLAFAIRTDIALRPGPWAAVEANLDHLAARLAGSAAIVGPLDAVARLGDHLAVGPSSSEPAVERAARWRLGPRDPGAIEDLDPDRSLLEEPPMVEWLDGTAPMTCPACGRRGEADRVARTIPTTGTGVEAQRCRSCRTVRLDGPTVGVPLVPAHLEDGRIDDYVEQLGAVEVIAATLASAGTRPAGTRVLDIGCGYGFGLAVAQGLWGWEGQGVDPGSAAALGAAALGHRLHRRPYGPAVDTGGPVDVVLASEIIEHVPDPLGLLRAVRGHLADTGVLVLTTPDADAVAPDRSLGDVLPAMGVGEHLCLLSAGSLRQLLAVAGFGAARVDRLGATLHAVAAADAAALEGTRPVAPHDLEAIGAWAIRRADAAPLGSALRVGLAARAARCFRHCALLDRSWEARALLVAAVRARHGIDLDDPAATLARIADGEVVPVVVADAHLTTGVLHLHHDQAERAAAHLLAAAAVAGACAPGTADPSVRWMEAHALGQAASALARHAPEAVDGVLRRLVRLAPQVAGVVDTDALVARAFTNVVAAGHVEVGERVRPLVRVPTDDALASGGEARRAALDGLFMGAMLDLQLGRADAAHPGFEECAMLARSFDDEHARRMVEDAEEHVQVAAARRAGDQGAATWP